MTFTDEQTAHSAEIAQFAPYAAELYIADTLRDEYYMCNPPEFKLLQSTVSLLQRRTEPFDLLGHAVYRRTYSRFNADRSRKESWWETVVRVIEGTFSWLHQHHKNNFLHFDIPKMQELATQMAIDLFDLKWSPPGRGLFAMGSDHVKRYGAAALNNCYATATKNLQEAASWTMDQLMNGGGVGFDCSWDGIIQEPNKQDTREFIIPDSRQGWCAALELLISAYVINPRTGRLGKFPIFNFSQIRSAGSPIKGFGGTSMGPEPLRVLLARAEIFLDTYLDYDRHGDPRCILTMMQRLYEQKVFEIDGASQHMSAERYAQLVAQVEAIIDRKSYGKERLVVDLMNSIGCCVVAGNVRRSAMIAVEDASNEKFYDLKDYVLNPERSFIAGMSNNSIRLTTDEDFKTYLPLIAQRTDIQGELPGLINMKNVRRFRRVGHELEPDTGSIPNPCGEIILPDKGPCCLATVYPTRCVDDAEWKRCCLHATRYAKIVTTIPHPWSCTNLVVQRERRIGVSQTGLAILYDRDPIKFRTDISQRYKDIRQCDDEISDQWGIPRSIRVTAIKPEGTLSLLAGTPAGMHFPIASSYFRRVRYARDHPDLTLFEQAGLPIDIDPRTDNTKVVTFPCHYAHKVRTTKQVNFFEQLNLAKTLQEAYSDNSVSSTSFYDSSHNGERVAHAIAVNLPGLKSASFMPYFDAEELAKCFPLLPEEPISDQTYYDLMAKIKPIEWNCSRDQTDGQMPRGCTGDNCMRVSTN